VQRIVLGAILFCIAIIFVAFYGVAPQQEPLENKDTELINIQTLVEIPPAPSVDRFGFVADGVDYSDGKINRNESLYIILNRFGVSPQKIYEIQRQTAGLVDLNRLIPGQNYRIYSSQDIPFAFVWQYDLTEFVTIQWDDENVKVTDGHIPVDFVDQVSSGIITNSLYESVRAENASRMLGSKLAEIFGWEVDFFALQRGDHYKAIYQDRYANDQYIGIGDVKAAEFQHKGEIFRAYYFDNGERRGYFDEKGNSLQKELLKAPFRYSQRVSSGFSSNRFHPILKQNRPHYGTDYAAPTGTPVIAVGDGVVIEAQRRGGNGNIVQIRHNSSYKTAYLHLNGFAPGIKRGVQVKQGDVIGYVGQSGLATGPHLCYRMYVNERPVNSQRIDLPASNSLENEYMSDFLSEVYRLDRMLDDIRLNQNLALQQE
jgi:murein DD-endopeptidase MepM/ murein hydrolase activator NlpD